MAAKPLETDILRVWDVQQAEEFIATIRDRVASCGYAISIVGGVARDGYSHHDLDLLLVASQENPDYNGALEVFAKPGAVNEEASPYCDGAVIQIQTADCRVVDIFFTTPAGVITSAPRLDPIDATRAETEVQSERCAA